VTIATRVEKFYNIDPFSGIKHSKIIKIILVSSITSLFFNRKMCTEWGSGGRSPQLGLQKSSSISKTDFLLYGEAVWGQSPPVRASEI